MNNMYNTNKNGKRKNIFISYRVHDTAGETGRLVDTLKYHFYEDQVFMDIEKLEPGVDFTEVIERSLEQCDVMLAVIGTDWKGETPGSNKSRINKDNDWVRLELATALQRNIKVIPVLVNGSVLPEAEELPQELQPLLKRQTYEISNKRWKYDTDQLVQYLIKFGIQPKNPDPVKKTGSKMSTGIKILVGGLAMLGLLAVIGLLLPQEENKKNNNIEPAYNYSTESNKTSNNNLDNNADNKNVAEPEQPVTINANIAGNWNESNGMYYMVITQNGSIINAQSFSTSGQATGEGTGTVNGNNMALNMNIYGTGYINIKASLSADENNLTGSYLIERNGASYTEPFKLIRQF